MSQRAPLTMVEATRAVFARFGRTAENYIALPLADALFSVLAVDIRHPDTGEALVERGALMTEARISIAQQFGFTFVLCKNLLLEANDDRVWFYVEVFEKKLDRDN